MQTPISLKKLLTLIVLLAVCLSPATGARAQTVSTLLSFAGSPNGAYPQYLLTEGPDGNFYGSTFAGGTFGGGTIFKMTPSGVETVIYSFDLPFGGASGALTLGANGNYYGMTDAGGAFSNGTIFEITPTGTLTTLYSFTGGSDGNWPVGSLTLGTDGDFYGLTQDGGDYGDGNFFKITPTGVFTNIYSLEDPNWGGTDGESPNGSLVLGSDGNFYGTTDDEFNDGWAGTVFEVTPEGAFTTLHPFTGGTDGGSPTGPVALGTNGNFYGTTSNGGTNGDGTFFAITSAGELTTLYAATQPGSLPATVTRGSDGNYYGTAGAGGANNADTVIKLTPAGVPSTLYSFAAPQPDFLFGPSALTLGTDGNFYGALGLGGSRTASWQGTLYKVTPSGALTTLTDLAGGSDGESPVGAPVLGTNGSFYGTTAFGGANGLGSVYTVTPGGTLKTLYSFSGGSDGGIPLTSLAQGTDGNFYGPTGYGTIFKITTSSELTTICSSLHSSQASGLTLGPDGNFYFVVPDAGDNGNGAIFRITPSGTLTTLYSFAGYPDAADPQGSLIVGPDNDLYGTAGDGGANGAGAVYKISITGDYHLVYSFSGGSDGGGPYTSLVLDSDGNLYGTTGKGGANGYGTVFQLTPTGTLTTLASFPSLSESDFLNGGGLAVGSNGDIYGTTEFGGLHGFGQVFQLTGSGSFTSVYSFTGGADGYFPTASLTPGTNGDLYSVTPMGGANGGGTIFVLSLASTAPPAPAGFTATAGNAQITLSWTASTGATSYNVYRGTASGSESTTAIATGDTSTTYTNSGLKNGTTYFYKVAAVDAAGTSALSNEASSTPTAGLVHILWSNSGALSLWNYNPSTGSYTQNSYGPYAGWTPTAIADGPDGLTRVLWVSTGGAAAIWIVNTSTGVYTQNTFGPYPDWTATALTVSPSNTTHVLWTSTSGAAAIWNYTGTPTITQATFGPFPAWGTKTIADGPDGLTRVLWVNSGGAASIWSLNDGTGAYTQESFGPFAGWTPIDVSVNAANTTHVLWTTAGGAAALWNLNTSTGNFTQNAYGPFAGWTPTSIADGPDGNTQVLWDNSGASSIWDVVDATGAFTQDTVGPFKGWTATAITAYP
ncbi:MAG: choice-of-anchor tandem repeat GloVer-containing protein [Capsulimonadaceae bacterium]